MYQMLSLSDIMDGARRMMARPRESRLPEVGDSSLNRTVTGVEEYRDEGGRVRRRIHVICDCGVAYQLAESVYLRGGGGRCRICELRRSRKPVTYRGSMRVIQSYKEAARVRGIEYLLSKDQAFDMIVKPCVYCLSEGSNSRVVYTNDGDEMFPYNGIDRVENDKGYLVDNVVPCCKRCNLAKRDASIDEWMTWLQSLGADTLSIKARMKEYGYKGWLDANE